MTARTTIGLCLACGVILSGCAENQLRTEGLYAENLQRTDTINSFAGDAVARNKAIQTINPTPYRARYRHLHFNGQRMKNTMDYYEAPPSAASKKVTGTGISKF